MAESHIAKQRKSNPAWLHVEVTWEAKQIAKIAALQSGMAFSSYIEQLLRRAKPINPVRLQEFVINDEPQANPEQKHQSTAANSRPQ